MHKPRGLSREMGLLRSWKQRSWWTSNFSLRTWTSWHHSLRGDDIDDKLSDIVLAHEHSSYQSQCFLCMCTWCVRQNTLNQSQSMTFLACKLCGLPGNLSRPHIETCCGNFGITSQLIFPLKLQACLQAVSTKSNLHTAHNFLWYWSQDSWATWALNLNTQ